MKDIAPGANTVKALSPLLKGVYPTPRKRKTKSKRFDRIARLLELDKSLL